MQGKIRLLGNVHLSSICDQNLVSEFRQSLHYKYMFSKISVTTAMSDERLNFLVRNENEVSEHLISDHYIIPIALKSKATQN